MNIFYSFLPTIILIFSIILLFSIITFQKGSHFFCANTSILSLIAFLFFLWNRENDLIKLNNNFFLENFYSKLLTTLVVSIIAFSIVFLYRKNEEPKKNREEFYIFVLIFSIGSFLLINFNHMMVFYIGMEIISISLFGMLSFDIHSKDNTIILPYIRYTLLSTISSTFLLFGIALFYLEIRTFNFPDIKSFMLNFTVLDHPIFLLGLSFVLTSIFFKLSLFPFCFWMNEMYNCMSIVNYIYVSIIGKLVIFLTIIFLFIRIPILEEKKFSILVQIISGISILYGGIYFIIKKQKINLKNILKIFSINYFGYMIIGICFLNCLEKNGKEHTILSVLFNLNLINYLLSNISIIYLLLKDDKFCKPTLIDSTMLNIKNKYQYNNFFCKLPIKSLCSIVTIFSFSGLPILVCFFNKFYSSLLMQLRNSQSILIFYSFIVGCVVNFIYLFNFIVHVVQDFLSYKEEERTYQDIILVIISLINIIFVFIIVKIPNFSLFSQIEKIFL